MAVGGKTSSGAAKITLTEHEGMLLALVVRSQPVRPYQVYKMFEDSPVTSINSSKGQIYPAIRRLKEKGLLTSLQVGGNARKVEELSVTKKGTQAAAAWIMQIRDSHINLDDPLRTRVLSFDLLDREQKIAWITDAKALVRARREEVAAFNARVDVPYQDFAYRSTIEMLRVKMDWLDELLHHVVKTK